MRSKADEIILLLEGTRAASLCTNIDHVRVSSRVVLTLVAIIAFSILEEAYTAILKVSRSFFRRKRRCSGTIAIEQAARTGPLHVGQRTLLDLTGAFIRIIRAFKHVNALASGSLFAVAIPREELAYERTFCWNVMNVLAVAVGAISAQMETAEWGALWC